MTQPVKPSKRPNAILPWVLIPLGLFAFLVILGSKAVAESNAATITYCALGLIVCSVGAAIICAVNAARTSVLRGVEALVAGKAEAKTNHDSTTVS
jgi:hypothetical protein